MTVARQARRRRARSLQRRRRRGSARSAAWRRRLARSRASVGSNGVDLRDDRRRPCRPPCGPRGRGRSTISSSRERPLGAGQRLLEDDDLDLALEVVDAWRTSSSSRRACGSSSPRRPCRRSSPTRRPCGPRRSAQRAVDLRAQRLAHRLERVLGDEQADDSFSSASSSRRSNSSIGIGGCDGARERRLAPPAGRRRSRRGRRSSPGRSARPAGPSGRRPARPRAPRACPCASRRWSRRRRT